MTRLSRALLDWFGRAARALPWRTPAPRDPYAVWVSEVMLQQTRVDTVAPRYRSFLRAFPTAEALAAASEERVMKAWEGLGYYRRARNLHAGARHVAEHGLPGTRDEWLRVPGVGPYTAGAIASLAHGEPVPAVDGNVLRVWSRIEAREDDIAAPATRRAAEAWVLDHQPRADAGTFNEALMELGATVCTPAAPRCGHCPLSGLCAGRGRDDLPHKRAKKPARRVRVSLAVVRRGDLLLLEKRERGLLAGTWGLPWVEGGPAELASHVSALVGARARAGDVVATGEHAFTHRRWEMHAYSVTTLGSGGDWLSPSDVALGTAHRKLLSSVLFR